MRKVSSTKVLKKKEPVHLSHKPLRNGNKHLFLWWYDDEHKRVREYLGMYIIPEKTSHDRIVNQNTMQAALEMQAKRTNEYNSNVAGLKNKPKSARKKTNLHAWMLQYIERRKKLGHSKSILTTLHNVDMHLVESCGDQVYIEDIDKDFVVDFILYLKTAKSMNNKKDSKEKRQLSQPTARLYYNTFVTALNDAVRDGVIPGNPANMLKRDEKKYVTRNESSRTYLTIEELKLLAVTELDTFPQIKQAFMFACFSGLRISDIRTLCWKHIHNEDEDCMLQKVMVKTQRTIRLKVNQNMKEWLPERGDKTTDDLVFDLPSNDTITKRIPKWGKKAGLEKDLCFHMSRHTFATMALTLGADIYTTSKLLGHSSVRTTQIYADIIDQKKKDTMELFDNVKLTD